MKSRGEALLLAAFLALIFTGCGEVVLTDVDDGLTREVLLGTRFSISLPAGPRERLVRWKGSILKPLDHRIDQASSREIIQFEAAGLGQDEVRISGTSGREYLFRIKVKSASEEPTVHVHQP